MRRFFTLLAILFTTVSFAQTALYVDSSVSSSGAGTSWSAAYKTLNEALTVVNAAGSSARFTVRVARGTYYPTGAQSATNRDSSFLIRRGGVQLEGGYPTGGGARDIAANTTLLSGNIGNAADSADNSYHVMIASGLAAGDTLAISGFTFSYGCANSTLGRTVNGVYMLRSYGGALRVSSNRNTVMISDCVFYRNTAIDEGGALYAYNLAVGTLASSRLFLSNCSFDQNRAVTRSGGALISMDGGIDTIRNCTFTGNLSRSAAGMYIQTLPHSFAATSTFVADCSFTRNTCQANGYGGGLYLYTSAEDYTARTVVTGCVFDGNQNPGYGGGLAVITSCPGLDTSTTTITGCVFVNNRGGNGAGISNLMSYNYDGIPATTIANCRIIGNQATASGGGIHTENTGGAVTIRATLDSGNTAGVNGGGIYNSGSAVIDSVDFINNQSGSGGGAIYNNNLTVPITAASLISRCRIMANKALNGAGIFSNRSSVVIRSTLITGNRASGSGGAMYNQGGASPIIVNSTLVNDSAVSGPGIYTTANTFNPATPAVTSSIVWEGPAPFLTVGSSTLAVSYSTVSGGYAGTGNTSADPRFVSPAVSSVAPTTAGDYSLQVCSPAINRGLNAGSYSGLLDLAAQSRLFGARIDMGAYEYQAAGTAPGPITGRSRICLSGPEQLGNDTAGGVWSNTNPAVATISSTGLVTPVAVGTDTVYYTTGATGCRTSAIAIITVHAPPVVAAITGAATVCASDTVRLSSATAGGVWSSADTAIAKISSTGLVTGQSAGTVSISYTLYATPCTTAVSFPLTVNVLPAVAANSGMPARLCTADTARVGNATPGGVWSSSNTAVATVSSTGLVTGIAPGTDTIYYTVTNALGCSRSVRSVVTINAPPVVSPIAGVSTVCTGSAIRLTNSDTSGVWSNADTTIAAVSDSGRVSGLTPGRDTVFYTVTLGCATQVYALIDVVPLPLIDPLTGRDTVCRRSSAQLSSATAGGIWSSTNAGIVSVDTSGLITGISGGPANIIYTVTDSNACVDTAMLPVYVTALDVRLWQQDNTLRVNQNGAVYQWVECPSYMPVAGATQQRIEVTVAGSYAVIVSAAGCTDTSDCFAMTPVSTGVEASLADKVRIFPNPARDRLQVQAGSSAEVSRIRITDLAGHVLKSVVPMAGTTSIDLQELARGVYFIEVVGRGEKLVRKVVLQ